MKFAALTGALILAVVSVVTAFLTRQQEATIRNELARRAIALTESLAYNCQLPLVTENTTSLQRLGTGVLKDPEAAYVQFQNARGAVVLRVGGLDPDSLGVTPIDAVRTRLEPTRVVWLRGPDGVRYLDVHVPVTVQAASDDDILAANNNVSGQEPVGAVQVGMTTQFAEERIMRMRQLALVLGVLIALASGLAAGLVIRRISRPLEQLMEGNRRVGRGDFSVRMNVGSSDEFGRLARSWNQMSDEIQHSRELANRYLESLRDNAEELEEANRALKRKNEEIAKASRMKSEFLAVMSHELRTPLNGIIGFSEVLLDEKFGDLNQKQKRFTENTLSSGRHLLRLINDLLDLSKIEAGRIEVTPAGFELRQSFHEIQDLVRNLAQKKNVELRCDDIPAVTPSTDVKLFKQVMFNLLSNAIKFTPPGGRVDVQVRCLDGRTLRAEPISHAMSDKRRDCIANTDLILVEVRDTGVGIAPEDHEKVFAAFRQADTSYARAQEGTGLGLALTRRIVSSLGGDVWFTSQVGEGSCFAFFVPLHHSEDVVDHVRVLESRAAKDRAAHTEQFPTSPAHPEQEDVAATDAEAQFADALWPWSTIAGETTARVKAPTSQLDAVVDEARAKAPTS
jgi:signal transduction histidine kinase